MAAVEMMEIKLDGPLGFGELCSTKRPVAARKAAAAAGGILKSASWSDFETCVTHRPEVAWKVAMAEFGAGNKPAAADKGAKFKPAAADKGAKFKPSAAEEDVKFKPAGARKTKLVKVEQSFIDSLISFRAVCPRRPLCLDLETIDSVFENDPESREEIRLCWEEAAAVLKAAQDKDDEILNQYKANGSAYWEVEIRD